jgi:hypothetical protein
MRLLLTLAGFAISFVLPTFAQQKDGVDQEQRQVADSLARKLDEAWTRQRRFTNACRNDGAVSTVSTLALMVLYAIFGSLAQFGIRPHRKVSRVRCLVSGWRRIARTS